MFRPSSSRDKLGLLRQAVFSTVTTGVLGDSELADRLGGHDVACPSVRCHDSIPRRSNGLVM